MLNVMATFWWKWRRPAFEGAAWGAAIAVPLVAIDLSFEPTAKERQLCGEAVHTVLTTKDPLELVPEHNPLVLAKTVATVDRLSAGRFILGVGVGWLAEEFEALGVPFERRGQRTREYIDVMRKLWTERSSSHQGEFVKFTNVLSYPKPDSDKGVPVWFGGESNPALRRVAEYGDGWIGFNLLPDQAAQKVKRIEELLRVNGRKRSDVKLAASPYTNPITTDDLKRYRDADVEEVALVGLGRPGTEREMIAQLEQIAREFVEPAAKL
jgi:probable F420-dependent oxidoreductase